MPDERKLQVRKTVERHVKGYPIRLVRLSDFSFVSREALLEEVYERFLDKYATHWVSGDCKSEVSHLASYSILSHRWMAHELSMDDVKAIHSGDYRPTAEKEPAYAKITTFFAKSREYNCFYAWFDSGCIDQKNNAELTESIPAMYKWYQNANVCIVRLAGAVVGSNISDDDWFQRGWTLQELIAPTHLKIYDVLWNPVTTDRYDIIREPDWTTQGNISGPLARSLKPENPPEPSHITHEILNATGIDPISLSRFPPSAGRAPLVISWMAHRRTTQPEDRAYCILGLLALYIQMPLERGEAFEKAFFRVQMSAFACTRERSLLAWIGTPSVYNSMFASTPESCDFFLQTIDPISNEDAAICVIQPSFDVPHLVDKNTVKMLIYSLLDSSIISPEHSSAIMANITPSSQTAGIPGNLFLDILGSHSLKNSENPFNAADWEWNSAGRLPSDMPDVLHYAVLLVGNPSLLDQPFARVHTHRHIWLNPGWAEGAASCMNCWFY